MRRSLTLTTLLIAVASFATLLASAMAGDTQVRPVNAALVGADRMTFDTFDKDVVKNVWRFVKA
jgi:hypothetical protein